MPKLGTRQIIAFFVLAIMLGGLFVVPVKAQFVDPVTAPAQVTLGVSDQVQSVAEKLYNFSKDALKKVGATAYKTAGSAVLNTIAAELAKAVATGDFGGPMFSSSKDFFSGLADGVVGDLVNDIVNGALGIDLCNFDPSITLQFSLQLPFFKEYKYEPRCSLTKMSEHLQTLNVKKMFNLSSSISTKTVDSFGQIAESLGIDPTINNTVIVKVIGKFLDVYGGGKDFNNKLKADTQIMADIIGTDDPTQTRTQYADFKDDEQLVKLRESYQCQLAEGLYKHNLAIFSAKDFDEPGDPHDKDLTDCVAKIDKDQWPTKWKEGALKWLTSSNRQESTASLTELMTKMDVKAQAAKFTIKDSTGASYTYKSPLAAGMERVQYNYATCLAALNRVLDVKIVNTVEGQRKTLTSKTLTGGGFGLTVPTTGTTGTPGNLSSTSVFIDTNPAQGTYKEAQSLGFIVITNDSRTPIVRWREDGVDPTCDEASQDTDWNGDFHSPTTKNADGDWVVSGVGSIDKSKAYKAIACLPSASGQNVGSSGVQTFNFVINPNYVAPVGAEAPLQQRNGVFQETFFAPAVAIDPNKPTDFRDVWITYSQGGKKFTEPEFAACQIAFNSGALLSNFYTELNTAPDASFKYIPGANVYDGEKIIADMGIARVLSDNPLGGFSSMFHPNYVETEYDWFRLQQNERPEDMVGPNFFQAFLRYTLTLDAEGQNKGQKMRDAFKNAINKTTASLIGVQEVVATLSQQIDQAFWNLNFPADDNKLSADERLNEFGKTLEPGGNEKATSSQLTKKLLDEKYKKKSEEERFAAEKGTLLNPETSAVSEQAKNTPEVIASQQDKAIKGQQPGFADFTGEIFADAMNVFLQTLWNQLLIKGLSSLNPELRKDLGVDSSLEARIAEQEACQKDPTQCKTALNDAQFGNDSPCDRKDLDILKSVDNIGKALGNLFTTGSGKIDGVSDTCQKAVDEERKTQGAGFNLSQFRISMEGILNVLKGFAQGIGSGQDLNKAPGSTQLIAPSSVDLTQRPESRSTTSTGFTSAFDDSKLANLDLGNPDAYDILGEMTICPKGQANRSLYNCTIDGKMRDAITQIISIQKAIDKKLIKPDLFVGVDDKGQEPLPGAGISLAAAQKLRKARILPIGFEFATRLKVACYQQNLMKDGALLPAEHPYKDISNECYFGLSIGLAEEVKLHNFLRDKVLSARLGDIVNGFNQSGGDNFVCGDFKPFVALGSTTMSPFCGLANPDWVLKLPTPSCDLFEYSDILQSQKGNNRFQTCTELTSDLGNGNNGYCLKERNIWDFTGQNCPAQYSTCTAYIFKDGTVDAFNKDSLVGGGLCNERNAGCTWVTTQKQGLSWVDTANAFDRGSCQQLSGTWDELANRCTNSRVYINGNIGFCSAADAGCTEVKLFKQSGSSLALDGSFEFTKPDTIPVLWKVGSQRSEADKNICVDGDANNPAGGQVSYLCTNVAFQDYNTCTANGGSWDSVGSTCSNASMPGITSQNRCGVCSFTGTDQSTNQSLRLFDSTSCDAVANHAWVGGNFQQLCSQEEQTCNPVAGSCTVDYSMYNNNKTECEKLDLGNFNSTGTEGVGDCRYKFAEGDLRSTRSGMFPNQPDQCALAKGDFSYDCPLFVRDGEASQGLHSLEVGLNSQSYKSGETIVASYPLKLADEASVMTLAGDTFSVSFDLKAFGLAPVDAGYTVRAELIKTYNGGRVDSKSLTIPVSEGYQRYSMTLTTLTNGTDLSLKLYMPYLATPGAKVYLDSVKLEYNTASQILSNDQLVSNYSEYQNNEGRFVKLPPSYLNCRGFSSAAPAPKAPGNITVASTCNDNGLYWDSANVYGDGAACYRYAPDPLDCGVRLCRADEAGCQMYTPTNGEPKVPGVVGQQDYCPQACNGYDTFKQQPSYFEPTPIAPINYFIPSTAKQCAVKDVGCDQFTNLSLGATANPIEYYTYLKQCVIPDTGKGEAGFFIWQGSAGGPPQLRTFTLQAEGGTCTVSGFTDQPQACKSAGGIFTYNGAGGPAVVSSDGYCAEADLGNNLDCLKFFDKTGKSYTRKLSYTIEANPSCQQLRKTDSDRQSCLATNGEWNNTESNCTYVALPQKSNKCEAQISGCREYYGNTGNNQFPVSFDNFESGSPSGWVNSGAPVGNPTDGLAITAESITTQGHSIYSAATVNSINKAVSIQTGRNYKLTFWAKNKQAESKSVGVKFSTAPSGREFVIAESNQAQVAGDWKYYEFGPVFVDWADTNNNNLIFSGIGDIYLDNVSVIALQESTYVVKNSWQTPQICNTTNLGAAMPQAQLGCQEYSDTAGNLTYIKSFTKLCRESSVGCQLVFNTFNSTNPLATTYNLTNDSKLDDVMVQQDKLMAVIINDASLCTEQAKGCMEVGFPTFTGIATPQFNQSVYVLNNPDAYDSPTKPILCKDEELGCVELKTFKGDRDFFKVDYANTCDYQTRTVTKKDDNGANNISLNGWFKTGSGIENLGCVSTSESTKSACENNGKVWNDEFSQCTNEVPGISFGSCSGPTFTDEYLNQLQNSCQTDFKGYWYNNGAQGCGCARYPFDYYKNTEYPENNVAAARCEEQFDQCTEYLDFNPNYIFNGDFEDENLTVAETNQAGEAANWTANSQINGRQRLESGEARTGGSVLKLTKNTTKDLPDALNQGDLSGLMGSPYYVSQNITRLERGQIYETNFAFKSDRVQGRGAIGAGDTGSCSLPQTAVELVPVLSDLQKSLFDRAQTEFLNHKNIQVFESTGDWKKVTAKFVIPEQVIELPVSKNNANVALTNNTDRGSRCTTEIGGFWSEPSATQGADETSCKAANFKWDTSGATDFCSGICYTQDPGEPTIDYQVRLYGPMNGACVNNRTGAKRYFDVQGRPLDRYLCEGTPKSSIEELFRTTSLDNHYAGYPDRQTSLDILDYDDTSALGQNDSWSWVGNCLGSNLSIDTFQVSPERESLYHFIDNGKLQTCGSPNWDSGCIEFENVLTGSTQKFQVKADRQCAEWLYCDPANRRPDGRCDYWTTCSEQDGNKCTRPGSQRDNFRYDLTETGALNPLNMTAYQQRVGVFEDYRINRWRSGDYTGYSIPILPPIEQLYDAVPGVAGIAADNDPQNTDTAKIPKYANGDDGKYSLSNDPRTSKSLNNAIFTVNDVFASAKLARICRGYPEETSPFPKILSNFVPGFDSVNTIVDKDGAQVGIGASERLVLCNYVKYSMNKGQQEFYFTETPTASAGLLVCNAGKNKGTICKTNDDCPKDPATTPPTYERCVAPSELASSTVEAEKKILTDSLGQKVFLGNIGVCLEEDSLIKVTGGFLGAGDDNIAQPTELNQRNTPHACLTFFPL